MIRRSAIVFALILVVAVITSAQQHPFNVHDLVAMQRIADPRPSPDGSRTAFVVTTMDLEANKGRKDIWMAATDGSGAYPLTTDADNDWSPRWQDDGTLYFLSLRTGSAQVWRWDFATGAAQQVTDLPLDIESLKVGPAGGALFAGIPVFPDCVESMDCTVKRLDARQKAKASGLVFDRVFVRHWDTHGAVLRVRNLKAEEGDRAFRRVRQAALSPVVERLARVVEDHQKAGKVSSEISAWAASSSTWETRRRCGTRPRPCWHASSKPFPGRRSAASWSSNSAAARAPTS